MRLFRPSFLLDSRPSTFFSIGLHGRKTVLLRLAIVFLVTILMMGIGKLAYDRLYNTAPLTSKDSAANVDDIAVRTFKDSTNPDDKRALISAYIGKADYDSALKIADQVADETKLLEDYMGVLAICSLYEVSSKQTCLDAVVGNLEPFISSMVFISAYSAGGMLENAGQKRESIDFYQRAYDTFDPNADGENRMTKEQLKNHIDELRG